jgi:hypothetical protein
MIYRGDCFVENAEKYFREKRTVENFVTLKFCFAE